MFRVSEDDILELAKRWIAHKGQKQSTISTYAAGDGKLFAHLESGGGCTLKRGRTIVTWFDNNWPADLEWPTGVQRPSSIEGAA